MTGGAGGSALPEPQQLAAVNQHLVRNLGQQLALERAFGQPAPERPGVAGHVGAAFGGIQIAALGRCFEQEPAER